MCQFEGLRNLRSRSLIRTALENLPKGLDATYDRLLLSIEPEFQAQVLSSLKWLAFSNRTLRLKELAEIFILHPERAVVIDEAERLFEPEEVLRYISSLVTVQKDDEFDIIYVRLAHFTVKEYLISSRIGKGPAACFSFTEDDAHLHISHCCLVYHFWKIDNNFFSMDRLLSRYAVRNWGWHLETAPRHNWTSDIVRIAARALSVGSDSLATILLSGMYSKTGTAYYEESSKKRHDYFLRRPYGYTARLGFLNLTDLLLSEASNAYKYLTQEDLNLILGEATWVGSIEIVQLALDKGANIDAQVNEGASVLQVAASRNHPEIVDLLLRRGADTYKMGCPLTSLMTSLPLGYYLTYRSDSKLKQHPNTGYTRILQLLVDNGADINKQCAIHGTALSTAAERAEYPDTRYLVDFLLQGGADVNLSGGFYGYPLQAACSKGILYSRYGWRVNKNGRPRNRLHGSNDDAGLDGDDNLDNEGVVMTLLEMGAEVNAQGGKIRKCPSSCELCRKLCGSPSFARQMR